MLSNIFKNYSRYIASFVIILSTVLIDQLSKIMVVKHFSNKSQYYAVQVNDFFNIVLAWNRGISFGMFSKYQASEYIFLVIAILITVAILIYILFYCINIIDIIFMSLICGGAIGNIIDRVRYGAVVDFIDIHIMEYSWPAFNFADSVICISAITLFIRNLFQKSQGN